MTLNIVELVFFFFFLSSLFWLEIVIQLKMILRGLYYLIKSIRVWNRNLEIHDPFASGAVVHELDKLTVMIIKMVN